MIATAGHCVWNGVYAYNVQFMPEQEGSPDPADWNCLNDPHGCWYPNHGIIHGNYTSNWIMWDFAIYKIVHGPDSHLSAE